MSELGYNFYMTSCTNKGEAIAGASRMNLEADFSGLRYSKAEGLDKVGAAKNIYTETYADSERTRVYVPDVVTNEPTTVNFTFFFVGDTRRESYDAFIAYVRNGCKVYYDDARKKYLYFFVKNEIKPAEEAHYGSVPYLKMTLSVQNIFGRTFDAPFDDAHLI